MRILKSAGSLNPFLEWVFDNVRARVKGHGQDEFDFFQIIAHCLPHLGGSMITDTVNAGLKRQVLGGNVYRKRQAGIGEERHDVRL